ncbi:MAG TPA: peptide transporter [Bdellovibrionales bacterium]|nr:peptide transporter [Bdellovibrionales bacterium]
MTKKQDQQMTQEEIDLHWYKTVYQGDNMPQLTFRAVLMGSVLGGVMSLSNLYVGLKTGWGLGVAITSCILSFTIYKSLMAIFPRWFTTEMSILENNCMQSTATSAGVSTGGTMVSAISAYLIITGTHISFGILTFWTFFLAALGVFLAIPMKRQMINIEQLRFPSGTAAAETLRSLHATGKESVKKAHALGYGGIFGVLITWFRDIGKPFAIPSSLPILPGGMLGASFAKWTINFDMSALLFAGGAIMGWRTAWSLLLGASLNYFILAPRMAELGAIDITKLGYRAIMAWSTWAGAAMMVSSGLLSFAMQWRVIGKSFSRLTGALKKKKPDAKVNPLDRIEVPASWFVIGTILSGMGCITILYTYFGTSIWMGIISVILAFFLSLVACRATGETDTTPIGAMGKITQLTFGVLAPSNMVTNLMTASVTAGAAGAAADLLTDLKSGYLLGANPRKQFIAQFIGIFAGTLVIVPAFYLIVPTAASLGTDQWPAPAAQVWAAVARVLASGFHALHPAARSGLFWGLVAGMALPLLERALPKGRKFIPSATSVGLAFVIPFFNTLSMFLGALAALIWEKKSPLTAEKYLIPVSSGIIAGESLMGIIVAIGQAKGWI